MRIVRDRRQLTALCREWRRRDDRELAFVPTMGNLHEGHLSLVRQARLQERRVIVSIFVNPLQFERADDLAAYPRTLEADTRLLAEAGVDALFCPEVDDMYPAAAAVAARVSVPALSGILEGASRPGHFDGVATVVAKLFNMVQPDVAVFGEKDFQQLRLIEAMVAALDFPLAIEPGPTVRAEDGLALSSRNGRLSPEARSQAGALYQALQRIVAAGWDPLRAVPVEAEAEAAALAALAGAGFTMDYLTVRRAPDLAAPAPGDRDLVVLAAGWLDGVRLIDNLRFPPAAFAGRG
jgi:pantoate--beta-alanine ligase